MELISGLAVTTVATVIAVWVNDKFNIGGSMPEEAADTADSGANSHSAGMGH